MGAQGQSLEGANNRAIHFGRDDFWRLAFWLLNLYKYLLLLPSSPFLPLSSNTDSFHTPRLRSHQFRGRSTQPLGTHRRCSLNSLSITHHRCEQVGTLLEQRSGRCGHFWFLGVPSQFTAPPLTPCRLLLILPPPHSAHSQSFHRPHVISQHQQHCETTNGLLISNSDPTEDPNHHQSHICCSIEPR